MSAKPRTDLIIRVQPECHEKLSALALKRSYELGRRVSMGFVIEELLGITEQVDDPEHRTVELFAAHD